MPYCYVEKRKSKTKAPHGSKVLEWKAEESTKIFYQLYGHGPNKVLFIIGLAGNHQAWAPQVFALCGTDKSHEEESAESRKRGEAEFPEVQACGALGESGSQFDTKREAGSGIEVCTFDNRGVGKSSIPEHKSEYSTETMAEDALALLDQLGWDKAHICGHSMGGMVASKLAAIAPHRLFSLTLIAVTGGGYQCIPKLNRTSLSIGYRLYRAKSPEERSAVDLDTHYTHDYLETVVGETKRRVLLYEEYVKNLSTGGMQPRHGFQGQASACWNHKLTDEELAKIRSAGVLVAVVHGRGDVIAQIEHARKLAKKLQPVSRMIELSGGHLVTYQNSHEVNGVLLDIVKAVQLNVQCYGFKGSGKEFEENGIMGSANRLGEKGGDKRTKSKQKSESWELGVFSCFGCF